jgi:hypothetical protein
MLDRYAGWGAQIAEARAFSPLGGERLRGALRSACATTRAVSNSCRVDPLCECAGYARLANRLRRNVDPLFQGDIGARNFRRRRQHVIDFHAD